MIRFMEQSVSVSNSGMEGDYITDKCDSSDSSYGEDCTSDGTLTVKVKMAGGGGEACLDLSGIDPTMNVRDLKCCIYKKLLEKDGSSGASVPKDSAKTVLKAVPVEQQRLIFSGKMLSRDSDTLGKDVKMKAGSTNFIHLAPIPVGQVLSMRKRSENKGVRPTPTRRSSTSTTGNNRSSPASQLTRRSRSASSLRSSSTNAGESRGYSQSLLDTVASLASNSGRPSSSVSSAISAAAARQARARFALELANISSPAVRLSGAAHAQHLVQRLSDSEALAEASALAQNQLQILLPSTISGVELHHHHHHYDPTILTRHISLPSLHRSTDMASRIASATASQQQAPLLNSVFPPVYPPAMNFVSDTVQDRTSNSLGHTPTIQGLGIHAVRQNFQNNTTISQEERPVHTSHRPVTGVDGGVSQSLENVSLMAQRLRPLHEELAPSLDRVQMLFNEEVERIHGYRNGSHEHEQRTAGQQAMITLELQNIANSLDRHAGQAQALASALRSVEFEQLTDHMITRQSVPGGSVQLTSRLAAELPLNVDASLPSAQLSSANIFGLRRSSADF